ncbi:hypothetical protein [Natronoglomus mannanivorans]|uniref:Uncharacterized protein n=1 Tax=Natronoglomus mannanivorans TaxID=2979990 RepID=A0AAP2Z3G0_9EURY|nr:hypothetical protein [Halobacteria archaeon AArc-xg1-1]
MSSIPNVDDQSDEDVEEYIDVLHDRIQFLTEELEEAERTILELRQGEGTDDREIVPSAGSDAVPPVRVAQYTEFLLRRFEYEEEEVEELLEPITDRFSDYIDTADDLHTASVALLMVLLKHEDVAE